MAKSPRREQRANGFDRKTLMPAKSFFFINGELVKLLHKNKAHNIAYVFNYVQWKEQVLRWTDFLKNRERAFSISAAAWVLGYSRKGILDNIYRGNIFRPYYLTPNGKPQWNRRGYYSESQVYELRDLLAFVDQGRPRKDGRLNSRCISEAELRYRLGDGMLLYTQSPDGEMIPVWGETL